jgi:hypothetical protein
VIDPVIIDFTTAGIPSVNRAFATVEQSIDRLEKHSTRSSEAGTKARVRGAQAEAKDRERAAAKIAKDAERLERQHTREVEKETARRAGIVRKSSEMAGRYANEQVKADARAQQAHTRTVEREAERRMRIQIRSSEMAGRMAVRAVAEEQAATEKAQSTWSTRGRAVGGVITRSVGRTLGGVASIIGAGAGIGGGLLVANAARGEMSAHKSAQLIMNAVTNNGVVPAGASVDAILGKASQVARAEGVSKTEVADAALAYSRSATGGDFQGLMGNMGFFAKVHNVTGADMNDLATSAGVLQSQNPGLGGANNQKMQQMILDVLEQTHMGSLSMPEVSKMMGVIGSGRGAFGGEQGGNQRKLMALAQLVAPETDPLEAGTMVKDFSTEGQKHSKALGKLGVKYDAQGRMQSVEQAIDAVLTGTKGNYGKAIEAFGSDRGAKLFAHLNPIYNNAGGGEAGLAAVHQAVTAVTAATSTPEQLNKADKETLDDPARKLQVALNQITDEIGSGLEPELKHFADDTLPKLIPKFEAIIDEAGKLAGYFADNPIKGIGAVIVLSVTKDLVDAGISAAAQKGVATLFAKISSMVGGGGVTPPVSVPGAAPGGGGAFNILGKVFGVGGAILNATEALYKDFTGGQEGQKTGAAKAQAMLEGIKSGTVSAKDVDAALAQTTAGSIAIKNAEKTAAYADRFVTGGAGAAAAGTSVGQISAQIGEAAEIRKHKAEFLAALDEMTSGMKRTGVIASNTAPGNPALHVPIGAANR